MSKLSVILPIYNAQESLEADVNEVLEVLADAAHFELTILDDGSIDDTAEVARSLAARYPQVRIIRHPVRLGLSEAIQTGLDNTQGDVILVGDEDYCLDPDDLRTLWQLRDTQWDMARRKALPKIASQPWLAKLLSWRPRTGSPRRGFQIISRQAFEKVRLQEAVDTVHRLDIGWHKDEGGVDWPKFHAAAERAMEVDSYLPTFGGDYAAF